MMKKVNLLFSLIFIALSLVSCNKAEESFESLENTSYFVIKETETPGIVEKSYDFAKKSFDYTLNKNFTIDNDSFTCNLAEGYFNDDNSYSFILGSNNYSKKANEVFNLGDYNSAEFYMNFDLEYLSGIKFNVGEASLDSWFIFYSADEGSTYELVSGGKANDISFSATLDTPKKGRFVLVIIDKGNPYVELSNFSIFYGNTLEKPKLANVISSAYLDVKVTYTDEAITDASVSMIVETTLDHAYFGAKYYILYTKKTNLDNAIKAYYVSEDISSLSDKIDGSYEAINISSDNKLTYNVGNILEDITAIFVVEMNDKLYFTSEITNNVLNMINYYLDNNLIENEKLINALLLCK